MSVSKITEQHIAEATAMNSVDAAAKYLQDIAGIAEGDVASQHLSEKKWSDPNRRPSLIRAWLRAEAMYE